MLRKNKGVNVRDHQRERLVTDLRKGKLYIWLSHKTSNHSTLKKKEFGDLYLDSEEFYTSNGFEDVWRWCKCEEQMEAFYS